MAPLASRQSLGEHRGHVVTLVAGSRKYTKKTIVFFKKEAWQEIGVFCTAGYENRDEEAC